MLTVLCSGAGIALRAGYRDAKDHRDLLDLTSASPWPRENLLVPDGLPRDSALGWLDRTGLTVSFDLVTPDGREVPVTWQLHQPEPDGTVDDGVHCGAVDVVTCTDLGNGFTFGVSRRVPNSPIPSTALVWSDRGRVLSVRVAVPEDVAADVLRPVLTRTHRPTDAELLALLRPEGYRTDWT